MDPSRLCAVCPATEEVAVASADHAAPNGQDTGDPAVGRYVLHTLPRGICHQRAKRGCPHAVSELRRFLKKNFLIQEVSTGLIKMSYLGNIGCRSKRAST